MRVDAASRTGTHGKTRGRIQGGRLASHGAARAAPGSRNGGGLGLPRRRLAGGRADGAREPRADRLGAGTTAERRRVGRGRRLAGVAIQRPDGSVGDLGGTEEAPCWPTPYGVILWGVLGGYEPQRSRRACGLAAPPGGQGDPRERRPRARIVGHDPTLIGWPWVADTHSWLEPTALAILALRREGRGDHPRVREGVRLIADRAIVDGGWNYGNKAAFGHALRPQPAPTGLALLALAPERHPHDDRRQGDPLHLRQPDPGRQHAGPGVARMGRRFGLFAPGVEEPAERRRTGSRSPRTRRPAAPTPRPGCRSCSWPGAIVLWNSSPGTARAREVTVDDARNMLKRRAFLTGAGAVAAGGLGAKRTRLHDRNESASLRAEVFIASAASYYGSTSKGEDPRRGLVELGLGSRCLGIAGQVGPAQAEPGRTQPWPLPRSTPTRQP